MEWLKKLMEAINYIEEHLDKDLSYEEAAKIACCSTYYFQRMFSYVTGVSLSEYIRRRKMTQAAFLLQTTDKKVLEVALQFGYTSPTAFTRVFRSVHGVSPSAARNQSYVFHAYLPIRLSVQVIGEHALPYRIVQKDAFRVVGLYTSLCTDMEENHHRIPKFWCQMKKDICCQTLSALQNQKPDGILGVSAENRYYIAAATNQPAPIGMTALEIPAATWVIFEGNGNFQASVQEIFKRFVREWLPFSGYIYAYLPDIEVYPSFPGDASNSHFEVWIAVKKAKED